MAKKWTIGNAMEHLVINDFLFRQKELQAFVESLDKTRKLGKTNDIEKLYYEHIFLVAAEGGMGKTSLLRKFLNEAISRGFLTIYVDKDDYKISDINIFINILHDKLLNSSRGSLCRRLMQPYRNLLKQRDTVKRKIDKAREEYDRFVISGADSISAITSGVIPPIIAPVLNEGIKHIVHVGASLLAGFEDYFIDRLRQYKLSEQEFRLADNPTLILERFADCLQNIAEYQPLVFLIDDYHIIHELDAHLRFIIKAGSPNILWVIAGRENEDFLRNYHMEFDPRTHYVKEMLLNPFTDAEIEKFLEHNGILSGDVKKQKAFTQITSSLSKGIPLACQTIVNMDKQGVDIVEKFSDEGVLEIAREEVVQRLILTFLNPQLSSINSVGGTDTLFPYSLKEWIEIIALIPKIDFHLLSHLITNNGDSSSTNPTVILENISKKYSFVFGINRYKFHGLVKNVIRNYIKYRDSSINKVLYGKVILYYKEIIKDDQDKLVNPEKFVKSDKWKHSILALISAQFFIQSEEKDHIQTFIDASIVAHVYDPDFLMDLISLSKELSEYGSKFDEIYEFWNKNYIYKNLRMELGQGKALWELLYDKMWDLELNPQSCSYIAAKYAEVSYSMLSIEKALEAIQLAYKLHSESEKVNKIISETYSIIILAFLGFKLLDGEVIDEQEIQAHCQQVVKIDPNNIEIQRVFGWLYYHSNNFAEAITAFTKVTNFNHNDIVLFKYIGMSHYGNRNFNEALLYLTKYTQAFKLDYEPFIPLGEINIFHGNYEQGIELLQKAIQLVESRTIRAVASAYAHPIIPVLQAWGFVPVDNNFREILSLSEGLSHHLGQVRSNDQKIEQDFEIKSFVSLPQLPVYFDDSARNEFLTEQYTKIINIYIKQDKILEAQAVIHNAIKYNYINENIIISYAFINEKQGRLVQALEKLLEYADLNPNASSVLAYMAKLQYMNGEVNLALDNIRKAVKLTHGKNIYYDILINCLLSNNLFEEAIDTFIYIIINEVEIENISNLLKIITKDIDLINSIYLEKLSHAIDNIATSNNGIKTLLLFLNYIILAQLGRTEEAAYCLSMSKQSKNELPTEYQLMIDLLDMMTLDHISIEDREKIIDSANILGADRDGVRDNFDFILVNRYINENKHDDALKILGEMLQRNANDPKLYKLLGYTLLQVKDYQNAVLHLRKSIELDDNDQETYIILYDILNDGYVTIDEVRDLFTMYLKKFPQE